MIDEAVVCLDRRVVNPSVVDAGGFTTWTLPYSVATNGSQGRVAVVNLDTEVELVVSRRSPTTVSAASGLSTANVAVGIAYQFRNVPSTIYMMGANGRPDRRVPVRLSYIWAFLSGTRSLDCIVTVPGRSPATVQFRDGAAAEGQELSIAAFTDSKRVALDFNTDSPWPVRLGMIAWDGQFDPHTTTQVP